MKKLQSEAFYKIAKTMIIIGYALCLGSIASFISMNVIAGKNPTIEFLYWQRMFINPIMTYVTMPGIWIFFIGNIGLFLNVEKKGQTTSIILFILSILILVNGHFIIIPFAKTVSTLAIQQLQTSQIIVEFSAKKSIEDTFGALNLLLLVAYLVLYIIKIRKPQFDGQYAQENQII